MEEILVIQQAEHEDPGAFAETAGRLDVGLRVVRVWLGEPVPRNPGAHPAVLIMGGAMNVGEVERYPFLADEMKLVRQCVARRKPLLGICLGSQLIAAALGARVYAGPVKEIGWHALTLTPEAQRDPLFEGFPSEQTVFQWHGQTFDLPAGAMRLAGSAAFHNQAYRLGECAWGIQYHLETTAAHVRDWIEHGTDEYAGLGYVDPQAVIRDIPLYEPVCRSMADSLFSRFIRIARSAAEGGK